MIMNCQYHVCIYDLLRNVLTQHLNDYPKVYERILHKCYSFVGNQLNKYKKVCRSVNKLTDIVHDNSISWVLVPIVIYISIPHDGNQKRSKGMPAGVIKCITMQHGTYFPRMSCPIEVTTHVYQLLSNMQYILHAVKFSLMQIVM